MLYLIPGFEHSCRDEQYVRLIEAIEANGNSVSPVEMSWKRKTMDDWIKQAGDQLVDTDSRDILLGFSVGAMIALQLAREKSFKALLLCSLSPYYAEYLEMLPESWSRSLGARRWSAFANYSLRKSASVQAEKTFIFVGEKEAKLFPSVQTTADDLHQYIPYSSLTMVPAAGHEIGNSEYMAAITRAVSSL